MKRILLHLFFIVIGLVGVVFIFGFVQFVFNQMEGSSPAPVTEETSTVAYNESSVSLLGWRLKPNILTTITRFQKHWIIYQYTFKTDQFGRRLVRTEDQSQREKFLIFFGCSFMMGQGLEDRDTLDDQLSDKLPQYGSYNYAVPGYGLGHVLTLVQNNQFDQQVKQREGLIIYLFPAFHIDRMVGGLETIDWAGPLPHFKWENDEFRQDGFIQERRLLYVKLARAYNQTFLRQKLYFSWPFHIGEYEKEMACRALDEIKKLTSRQFKKSRFLLVLHPQSLGKDLTFCLGKYGIEWLDLRDLGLGRGYRLTDLMIKGDGHPTGLMNRMIADEIAKYIHSHPGI